MKKIILFSLILPLLSCAHAPPQPAGNGWDQLTEKFLQGEFAANPDEAAHFGRHEYDGILPDLSKEGLAAETQRLNLAHAQIEAFPESQLNEKQKFERQYLLATIDGRLFWMTKTDQPYVNPNFYSGPLDPALYIVFNYAPAKTRMRAYIKFARAVPKAVDQIRANMRPPIPLPLLNQGQLVFKGLSSYMLDDISKAFAAVDDPDLQKELKAASAVASLALLNFSDWLETQRAKAAPGYSLGSDKMQEMLLATEKINTPLAEIEKIGRKDMEKNLKNLTAACAKYAPKLSVVACVKKEEGQKPTDSMLVVARRQLIELKKFIQTHDLVSIPSQEEALVDNSPPYMRWNMAFINRPGIYDKGLPSTYYISPPDPTWSKEKQTAYLRSEPHLLIISVHEVWPGHFLDGLHTNLLKPPMGLFGTYSATEGWAHYTEQMMVDAGLRADQPQVRIAQALEALLRDVRLLSALGLHTGKMTQAQSEKMFLKKAFADEGTAKQQAARGVFDPGYLNYTLGKLMILKLRDDWTASRGGVKAWKDFHDKYLSYGDAHIPLVRASMMGPTDTGVLF